MSIADWITDVLHECDNVNVGFYVDMILSLKVLNVELCLSGLVVLKLVEFNQSSLVAPVLLNEVHEVLSKVGLVGC